jgi:NADP-reducing hydrogenase subunit HndA
MDKKLQETINKYKDTKGALIPVLHEAQELYGYLPLRVQKMVSEGLNVPLTEVYGVVTFYTQFSLKPKGRFKVQVCMGTACYVKGSNLILEKMQEKLGIHVGDCTEDGKFSLEACRCIGACGLAPVIMINDDVYGRLTSDQIEGILDKYKDHPKALPVISNQRCNEYLKDLCRLAEINEMTTISKSRKNRSEEKTVEKWKLVGSHTARRTFITLSLERGMRPEVLMKITGHKSYRTMQKYVNITNKIVRNEFQRAWGTPLRLVKNSE